MDLSGKGSDILVPGDLDVIDAALQKIDPIAQMIHEHRTAGLAKRMVYLFCFGKNFLDQAEAMSLRRLERDHGISVNIFGFASGNVELNIIVHTVTNGGAPLLFTGLEQSRNGFRTDQRACGLLDDQQILSRIFVRHIDPGVFQGIRTAAATGDKSPYLSTKCQSAMATPPMKTLSLRAT